MWNDWMVFCMFKGGKSIRQKKKFAFKGEVTGEGERKKIWTVGGSSFGD